MKRAVIGFLLAAAGCAALPGLAAAQCEGGSTNAGYYLRDGSYVPGGCAYTNPLTPGQMYPSGAQSIPIMNPALGSSRLPGQVAPSGLLPVNSSDLGPSGSYVNQPNAAYPAGGLSAVGTSAGPGVPLLNDARAAQLAPNTTGPQGSINTLNAQLSPTFDRMNAATYAALAASGNLAALTGTGLPLSVAGALGVGQFAPSGVPADTINRGQPTMEHLPGQVAASSVRGAAAPNVILTPPGVSATTSLDPSAPNSVANTIVSPVPANNTAAAATTTNAATDAVSTELIQTPSSSGPPLRAAGAPGERIITINDTPGAAVTPPLPSAPPAPARGGPTYIGEERGGAPVVTYP